MSELCKTTSIRPAVTRFKLEAKSYSRLFFPSRRPIAMKRSWIELAVVGKIRKMAEMAGKWLPEEKKTTYPEKQS